jgi:ubiquinone/menaquinone biosynthesis C-methylase UbiE
MNGNKDETREMVSRAYAEALDRACEDAGSCCSPSASSVPSFGCGNPVAFAEVQTGQTVLDLGSGAGLDLLAAAEKVGPGGKVIGIDMTDAMIEAARENARRAGHENIEVRKGIIEVLPVEDASVDWVISNCVINLSPEKTKVFSELARVLRPGGRFSIYDMVVRDLPEWLRESAAAYAGCVAGAISEEEYLDGLRAAGLREVEVRDRVVFEAERIQLMAESEFGSLDLTPEDLKRRSAEIEGRIWSAHFVGGR